MTKRLFDIIASMLGLILFGPFLIFILIWIKIDSPGPIFFKQERVGLNGKLFKIHKFRTMYVNSEDKSTLTVGDDLRITNSGKLMRRLKIDELPQLIDVLFGKMSFVGPRPDLKEFIDIYPQEIKDKILSVKPGITDFASIELVDESNLLSKFSDPKKAYIKKILPMKQKFHLDYVNNHNMWMDITIIFLTIKRVLLR